MSLNCTRLTFLSLLEVPFSSKNQMCLDAQLSFQNCIDLKVDREDAYSSCFLDINIEKETPDIFKSSDKTVGNLKSEGVVTHLQKVLQRQASLSVDKSSTERVYDAPTTRWRYKRAASFDSRKMVLLFSIFSKTMFRIIWPAVVGDTLTRLCIAGVSRFPNSVLQADDRVLEGFIHNMRKPAIPEIRGHLQEKTKFGIVHFVYVILEDVSGHNIEYNVDQWLSSPTAVIGLVVTTVSISQSGTMGRVTWDYPRSWKILGVVRPMLGNEFEWMSYANTDIISCILPKVLANRKMWEAKVSLVVYTTVEMYKLDQMLLQFKWRQRISLLLRNLKELHNVDM
ncbi:hypothetical protein PVK06_043366 [Gossypium arboreum]|uniref:Uncharacterized protein n=1 Tax=Gossypium arboreum TaxID=29729 RepID=A0ABR0MN87_GOSAR|nr:hypothetical protein PVK06_043366 [Gossypium arboreum]